MMKDKALEGYYGTRFRTFVHRLYYGVNVYTTLHLRNEDACLFVDDLENKNILISS